MDKFRLLVCDAIAEPGIALLRQAAQVDDRRGIEAVQLAHIIASYQGVIVRSRTRLTAELIGQARLLKIIARAGVGTDNIDLAAAKQHGVVVVNTPLATTTAVAEHTLALMLALSRHIPQANTSIKAGKWEKGPLMGRELAGKTLGLIGFGRIGQAVARRARAFELQLLAYDPNIPDQNLLQQDVQPAGLAELFARSDLISIHTPLNPATRALISAESIAVMKAGVLLICTARGGIIDEQALLVGLNSGQVGGVALDVFESEPPGLSELIRHPKLIASPHIAAQTQQAQERAALHAAEEILGFIKNLPLRWQIG